MNDTTELTRYSAANLRRAAALALLACTATTAQAASFDCTKAVTRIEKLICADAELSQLDSALGRLYADARRGAADPAALKRAQRDWLGQRDRCRDSACVADAYRARIAALGGAGAAGSASTGSGAMTAMGEAKTQRTSKEVRLTQEGRNFKIDAAYPRLGVGTAAAAGERVLASVVDNEVDAFRTQYRELLAEGGHQGPPWELGIGYDGIYAAPRFWAVGLSSYGYTGGAHGGVQHLPVVIDRDSGKQVSPAGLFRSGSPWLEALSSHSYDALASREPFTPGDEWLRSGTAPKAENYEKLLPAADGLRVIFEQYQVGPYAIGFHEVTVPYAVLDGLLNPSLFPNG